MLTLFVCGDVMLARGIDQILAQPCDPTLYESYMDDARDYVTLAEEVSGPIPRGVAPSYPWGDALAILEEAAPDVRIVNLETAITCGGSPAPRKGIHYRVSPDNAACLTSARVDVCTLANNHVLDWGATGLVDTLATLDRLGIAHCGAGRDVTAAHQPVVLDLGAHGRVVVFAIGCADAGVPSSWAATATDLGVFAIDHLGEATRRRVCELIDPWRRPRTTIVLSVHWGPNWGYEIDDEHRRFAHHMIDHGGVDVIHGHSSHHVKGIEVHNGRPILYGCGDLLTDYEGIRGYEAYRGDLGLLYLVRLESSGALREIEMVPTRVRRFQITRADPDDARWLAATVARTSAELGTTVTLRHDRLVIGS